MKTDDLITLLATRASPVSSVSGARRLLIALVCGAACATAIMVVGLGLRPDMARAAALPMFWIKLAFPVSLVAVALVAVQRLARPGLRPRGSVAAILAPIALLWTMAASVLASAAPADRLALLLGNTWSTCPLNIAMLSLPVLMAVLWGLKGLAPTRLALTGAVAGWLAGAAGALVYALHCTEMQAPFLATWYVLGMAIPALAGAALGPRLLRW